MSPALHEIKVTSLKGVGKALQEKLQKIGVTSLQDLLFHLPLHYQDRTRITPIYAVQPGRSFVLQGTITSAQIEMGRRRSLICTLDDGTGVIRLRFYYFKSTQKNQLIQGATIRCFGEPRRGATGYELYHPEYTPVRDIHTEIQDEHLTPVYPSTEGMTQFRLRQLCAQALTYLDSPEGLQDLLPSSLQKDLQLWPLVEAIHYLHNPPPDANTAQMVEGHHPAQRRLSFEELLAHHLSLQQLRQQARRHSSPRLPCQQTLTQHLLQQLPFQLTAAQQRVLTEIAADIATDAPMLRLVQGDVGSGKTIVAALAALQAIENGYQAVLMAPTEILSEQHYKNFEQWLMPLGINVVMLTGKVKGKARQAQLLAMQSGEAKMVVGTHALFQDDVFFQQLGLIIVDEQHRFGVHQRMALRDKGKGDKDRDTTNNVPHQLIMTATPIPRTLAMSVYADLDCSVIDELPPGRTPVNTVVINDIQRDLVIERVRQACIEGRQAYWVCTLIEESETLQCQAAEATATLLSKSLPELAIGLVHGRMKSHEKNTVMQAFKQGDLHLLVATTVIEVGVDVPNASLMIIENPERLGLSQLHQLRGRVGRGSVASHCLLMYHAPLSKQSRERLQVMRDSCDGFVIAEKDLELRGPGEVLGTRQTGVVQFRVADLERDKALLPMVHEAAHHIQQKTPHIIDPLIKRWLPQREEYLNV